MSLFNRAFGQPVEMLKGSRVTAAHVLDGALTLKLKGSAGEVVIDVPGRCELKNEEGAIGHDALGFSGAIGQIVGAKVKRVALERGKSIYLDLGKTGTLFISLREGEYPGMHALRLNAPGKVHASYHCDGSTELRL